MDTLIIILFCWVWAFGLGYVFFRMFNKWNESYGEAKVATTMLVFMIAMFVWPSILGWEIGERL